MSASPSDVAEAAKVILTTASLASPMFIFYWPRKTATMQVAAVVLAVAVMARSWGQIASNYVPEPYLDEVFHIPQAQKYCEGKFREWDDKITTPPGLYLVSLIIPKKIMSSSFYEAFSCDAPSLRGVNALCLAALTWLAIQSRHQIDALNHRASTSGPSTYAVHSALNIALCPVIFFFSGLYYTDVISAVAVLAAVLHSLRRMSQAEPTLSSDLITIILGILALFMRQTNVFWVVVFVGGQEAVHAVKTVRTTDPRQGSEATAAGGIKSLVTRYSRGEAHDPPLNQSWPDDVLLAVLSLITGAVCNLPRVMRQIWPHITVLAAFSVFVAWNGGVVLGDKSNHVATIHLAQMLYIWPLFAFFSLPLLLPHIVQLYAVVCGAVSTTTTDPDTTARISEKQPKASSSKSSTASKKSTATSDINSRTPAWKAALFGLYLSSTIAISAAIVKYNTIIHPFTLADNRHYMFYVFRYTIRRSEIIRQALVVPYTVSRWVIWGALSGCFAWPLTSSSRRGYGSPVATSTGLIFLLATTLSLISAPLVEPRYFIVPWIIWRILVPEWRDERWSWLSLYDMRLVLETLWFVVINIGTMYMFLLKPYLWRAEDGTVLDDGRWQRFMW